MFLVHADQILSVAIRVTRVFVHASQITLDVRQIAALNVPATPNVPRTWHASMKDVKIHVQVVVVITLVVVLLAINQFAVVKINILVIHSLDVIRFRVRRKHIEISRVHQYKSLSLIFY